MTRLVLVAALALYGLCTSYAAVLAEGAASTDAPNLVAIIANTTTIRPTTAARVINKTTTNHTTTAHVTNTTTARPTTTAHVTHTTTTNHTTTAHVTNTTTANHTTTAHVTNTTAHVTNTTAHVTNTTAHVTNTTAHVTNTTAHVTNTTATNPTTTMHAPTTVLPTLSPKYSLPITGQYNVSIKNTTCIKAAIGIQLIVKQKANDLYFNIPPREAVTSGKCGKVSSWINLKFNSGFVNFTFVKDGKQYYINEISVALHSMNNLGASYHGVVKNMKLFKTTLGHAYKCKSKQVVAFSTDSLQILVVDTLLQAFDIPGGKFGKVEECFMDHKIIVPIIFVAVFALIIIVIIVYLIYRRQRAVGYQRI